MVRTSAPCGGTAASEPGGPSLDRRGLLAGTAAGSLLALLPRIGSAIQTTARLLPATAAPVPLTAVRLRPSRYLAAVDANRRYVLSLDADRLLHNYRTSAGLAAKAAAYGGWEAETIAGHTLGHWLSALALLYAQTGDASAKERASYVVGELETCQRAHGDGYVAGFTRKRADGTLVDGKEIFAEIIRGDIRPAPFDLNGCWVPFYNWHKLMAGLRDADRWCGDGRAVAVARGLGGYIERVVSALDADQVEHMLACEHGGINEAFADLYARTGEARWLALAERFYHHRILDALAAGRDELAGIHANTQIPKLIGLARLHELTGRADYGAAARFFWETVTREHSYVIGGNSDREYFVAARSVAGYLTEQTCEGCNTYNMLKLTRQLFALRPDGALFDYYERAHLNHVLAQQDPSSGAFTYMMPLMSGAAREYSSPFDSFWCCVGTGMESHAKHGDSVYWQAGDTLFVNLYVPSTVEWAEHGATWTLDTRYPHDGEIRMQLSALRKAPSFTVALRQPSWCGGARVNVNGRGVQPAQESGYLLVHRRWREGDVLTLNLPLELRLEPTPDDPRTTAVLRGPLVLAADLGADTQAVDGPALALVADEPLARLRAVDGSQSRYRSVDLVRPRDCEFVPFHDQHRRRSAVYFRRLSAHEWDEAEHAASLEAAESRALAARSIDYVQLGDETSEAAHGLTSALSYALTYRGRAGRDARNGGFMSFLVAVHGGPLALRLTYWGEERPRSFFIRVDGAALATQFLARDRPGEFYDVEYRLPAEATAGRTQVTIRVEPAPGSSAGPLFGCRVVPAGLPALGS